ncbi:hypothetical protein GCM10027169_11790 [Gordonia jinhuaensis]|uniref:Membrane protein insertase YidC n=1 Tax=Gordonia jinhuaensis TaxID=1517702 RepID=A0A916WUE6_9ACTN|nr:membrane protein insertase YidC [Gordonia jinhuaensis]GGB31565.1 hypothetical protein GCM10011489_19710 [Gordonia jinhuaensis]
MLNFIYYPVSAIMWAWHWLFDHMMPDTPGWNGIAWALSVVFLVFTLRAILYKPFVKQIRTTKKMQEINPQLQAIRKKYANDRVKMTEEMQKLQREHGFNPLLGCLPMLLQIPVFIGLFHVLRSFNRTGHGVGQLGMTVQETRSTGNYVFNAEQVRNFLDARLFGVPLSSYITEPKSEWTAFVASGRVEDIDFTRLSISYVVVPLMIIAAIATHMNSRASVARQGPEAAANPQTAIMNKLSLYVFPLGILVSGPFFPVAILLYWVSNNLWTYGQQHIVFGKIAKEEEAAKLAKAEKLKANAPKPGAKPVNPKKGGGSATSGSGSPSGGGQWDEAAADGASVDGVVEGSDASTSVSDPQSQASSPAPRRRWGRKQASADGASAAIGSASSGSTSATGSTGGSGSAGNASAPKTPRPGQKPTGARNKGTQSKNGQARNTPNKSQPKSKKAGGNRKKR